MLLHDCDDDAKLLKEELQKKDEGYTLSQISLMPVHLLVTVVHITYIMYICNIDLTVSENWYPNQYKNNIVVIDVDAVK